MTTINAHIDSLKSEFAKLSASRRSKLASDAVKYIRQNPGMADANGFWRGLSARHVIAANVASK